MKTKKIRIAALFAITLAMGASAPVLAAEKTKLVTEKLATEKPVTEIPVMEKLATAKKDMPHFKGAESFIRTYPLATDVNFLVKEKFIEVNFTWNNMQLQAFYDLDGTYIGTSRKIAVNDIPLPFLMSIKKEYAGFVPVEVIEFSQDDNGLNYYVTVVAPQKAYVLLVAADGNVSVFKKMKN